MRIQLSEDFLRIADRLQEPDELCSVDDEEVISKTLISLDNMAETSRLGLFIHTGYFIGQRIQMDGSVTGPCLTGSAFVEGVRSFSLNMMDATPIAPNAKRGLWFRTTDTIPKLGGLSLIDIHIDRRLVIDVHDATISQYTAVQSPNLPTWQQSSDV